MINEVKIRKKKIGGGYFQNVYEIVSRPGLVVKVPNRGGEYEEFEYESLELAKDNPEIFAEIHILKPKFVVMEELSAAEELFEEIAEDVESLGYTFIDALSDYQDMNKEEFGDEYPYLLEVLQNEALLDRFYELSELYTRAEGILDGLPDFHAGNIGIDKKGKIKFLDW